MIKEMLWYLGVLIVTVMILTPLISEIESRIGHKTPFLLDCFLAFILVLGFYLITGHYL